MKTEQLQIRNAMSGKLRPLSSKCIPRAVALELYPFPTVDYRYLYCFVQDHCLLARGQLAGNFFCVCMRIVGNIC